MTIEQSSLLREKRNLLLPLGSLLLLLLLLLLLWLRLPWPRENRDGLHLLETTHGGLRRVLPSLACLLVDEHRLSERVCAGGLDLQWCSGIGCGWWAREGVSAGRLCLEGLEACLLLLLLLLLGEG